jgi:flagellar biogenesis protein FliO
VSFSRARFLALSALVWAPSTLAAPAAVTQAAPTALTAPAAEAVPAAPAPAAPEADTQAAAPAPQAEAAPPSYLRQTPKSTGPEAGTKSETNIGLRATVAVILLLALGGAALFLKRRQKSPLRPSQVHLSMVAAVGVGNKAQVCLVTVGREAILLGVTEQSVTPLRVYPESELALVTAGDTTKEADSAPKSVSEEDDAKVDLERNFQALLSKASQGKSPRSKTHATRSSSVEEEDGELPAHLKAALETPAKAPRAAFAPPEGQASELARRFRSFQA